MSRNRFGTGLCFSLLLLMSAGAVRAATLYVNCGGKPGLTSIGAALKALPGGGPHTINVSGACHENVTIQNVDRLTLNAINGASITDASGGTLFVMSVDKSSTVDVNGFTFNGGEGVICGTNSACTFAANTFQGSVGDGVSFFYSFGNFTSGNVIQNSAGRGLVVHAGAVVRTFDLKTQQNGGTGVTAIAGGNLTMFESSSINNGGDGIQVLAHSTARMDSETIQDNGGHGILVESASEASLGEGSISNSGGAGVEIGDLSFVWFRGEVTLTGNQGGTDVECLPQFSATRGALTSIGSASTNCVEP